MHEMPSGDTLDQSGILPVEDEPGGDETPKSASMQVAEALAALEAWEPEPGETIGDDVKAGMSERLSFLQKAAQALESVGGDRDEAIAWLREQLPGVASKERSLGAIAILENIQD